jgi:hypothetical protein
MIHMGVRKQDKINARQLGRSERRGDEPFRTDRAHGRISPDSPEQRRVGQNVQSVEADEDGRVSQPRRGNVLRVPQVWAWRVLRPNYRAA